LKESQSVDFNFPNTSALSTISTTSNSNITTTPKQNYKPWNESWVPSNTNTTTNTAVLSTPQSVVAPLKRSFVDYDSEGITDNRSPSTKSIKSALQSDHSSNENNNITSCYNNQISPSHAHLFNASFINSPPTPQKQGQHIPATTFRLSSQSKESTPFTQPITAASPSTWSSQSTSSPSPFEYYPMSQPTPTPQSTTIQVPNTSTPCYLEYPVLQPNTIPQNPTTPPTHISQSYPDFQFQQPNTIQKNYVDFSIQQPMSIPQATAAIQQTISIPQATAAIQQTIAIPQATGIQHATPAIQLPTTIQQTNPIQQTPDLYLFNSLQNMVLEATPPEYLQTQNTAQHTPQHTSSIRTYHQMQYIDLTMDAIQPESDEGLTASFMYHNNNTHVPQTSTATPIMLNLGGAVIAEEQMRMKLSSFWTNIEKLQNFCIYHHLTKSTDCLHSPHKCLQKLEKNKCFKCLGSHQSQFCEKRGSSKRGVCAKCWVPFEFFSGHHDVMTAHSDTRYPNLLETYIKLESFAEKEMNPMLDIVEQFDKRKQWLMSDIDYKENILAYTLNMGNLETQYQTSLLK
jgi:hypothetical protein